MNEPNHVYRAWIRATPERIWQAITSPEFTRQYFHNMIIESEWEVGSPVVFRYPDDGRVGVEGKVLEHEPPSRLAYTWRFTFDPEVAAERPSRVTWTIEPRGEVTLLTVVHDDFDPDSRVLPMVTEGWSEVICSLKSLLETGEALPVAGNEESDAA